MTTEGVLGCSVLTHQLTRRTSPLPFLQALVWHSRALFLAMRLNLSHREAEVRRPDTRAAAWPSRRAYARRRVMHSAL